MLSMINFSGHFRAAVIYCDMSRSRQKTVPTYAKNYGGAPVVWYSLQFRSSSLRKRGMQLFELLHIASKAHSKIQWLSGGEAQRVTIARALINNPSIIIADEPTAHLDTANSRELMEILQELKAEGKTLLLSSHDPLVYESPVVDRVVNVRDGRIEV